MKTQSIAREAAEVAFLIISMTFFFFDIVGVFGLAFAITGMLLAFGLVIAICLKRPSEEQAR